MPLSFGPQTHHVSKLHTKCFGLLACVFFSNSKEVFSPWHHVDLIAFATISPNPLYRVKYRNTRCSSDNQYLTTQTREQIKEKGE